MVLAVVLTVALQLAVIYLPVANASSTRSR